MGLKFGIWFEPEMISPDSDLYREHPDWAISIPGRVGSLCRNQYVLDLSRKEVRDHAFESVAAVLHSTNCLRIVRESCTTDMCWGYTNCRRDCLRNFLICS